MNVVLLFHWRSSSFVFVQQNVTLDAILQVRLAVTTHSCADVLATERSFQNIKPWIVFACEVTSHKVKGTGKGQSRSLRHAPPLLAALVQFYNKLYKNKGVIGGSRHSSALDSASWFKIPDESWMFRSHHLLQDPLFFWLKMELFLVLDQNLNTSLDKLPKTLAQALFLKITGHVIYFMW